MSNRDDLIGITMEEATDNGLYMGTLTAEDIADAILAAGYRKPRTITTVEELDALPDDSVVLDEMDGPLIKVGSWFHSPTDEMDSRSVIFPATVLYEPPAA